MKIIAPTNGDGGFKLPSPGIHKAKVVQVEELGERTNPFKPGKKERRLKIVWELLEDASLQYQWLNPTLALNSTFRPIAEHLLGIAIPPGYELEPDSLVGKGCEIEIQHYTDTKGNRRSKVTRTYPLTTAA